MASQRRENEIKDGRKEETRARIPQQVSINTAQVTSKTAAAEEEEEEKEEE